MAYSSTVSLMGEYEVEFRSVVLKCADLSALWSLATCRQQRRDRVATDESGDRSPHSKTSYRVVVPTSFNCQDFRLAKILFLDRLDLGHPFPVSLFSQFRCQPGLHNLAHLRAGNRFASQTENVGAVVLARVAGDFN